MKIIELFNCESALAKLFNYGLLPVEQTFFLNSARGKVASTLEAYCQTRNGLLEKYGTAKGGGQFTIPAGEKADNFLGELEKLNNQEADIDFPPEKVTLCVESIDKAEKDLPPDKRLGFSANDWAAIREIIRVVESETAL